MDLHQSTRLTSDRFLISYGTDKIPELSWYNITQISLVGVVSTSGTRRLLKDFSFKHYSK